MKNKRVIWIVVIAVSAVVFLYAAANLLHYYYQGKEQKELLSELAALRQKAVGEESGKDDRAAQQPSEAENPREDAGAYSPQQLKALYESMKDINEDYVLWVSIPGTEIDYPVVYLDNEYYLKHDFYDRRNARGTVFLDESCDPQGAYLLLHGHHMKDGSMFAALTAFQDKTFRKEHPEAVILQEGTKRQYRFFAGAKVDLTDEKSFLYEKLPADQKQLEAYVDDLSLRCFWYEKPELEANAGLLVLSTCDYGTEDQRLVLFALEKTAAKEK